MEKQEIKNLTVYYDGLCQLCSREIDHYKKQQGSQNIQFVDITLADFDASKENLDPIKVHKIMHVKLSDGTVKTKVDAFIEIWKWLPKYQFAVKTSQYFFVRPILNIGYDVFAKIRPYLPKKKALNCDASPYCEEKHV
jgi:predicted DCC family thiol-disulfide oxidoreductase YuxK